jgi:drug/metabolite transporter (DMT)-like permease
VTAVGSMAVAVVAAIGAALCFGAAGVLQQAATHRIPERPALSPAILVDLITIPSFGLGVLLGAAGFALQVTALSFGALIVVQPLLVTGVLFYLLFAARIRRVNPDPGLLLGVLITLAGLSAFLVLARPSGGGGQIAVQDALPLGVGLVVIVLFCVGLASRISSERRTLPLAGATAVCYGVTAGLVRSLTTTGLDASVWRQWELYAVVLIGPAGFLLNQNAFQKGTVGSLALGIITVGDPLVSIAVGVVWLGEVLTAGAAAVVGQVVALAVLVAGVFVVCTRAQKVAEELQRASKHTEEALP